MDPATTIDSGNTAWLLVSTALVMLMTPGLAFFYGGLVRRKNVLSTIMHSFFILALISVQWVLWGYSLAFGPDTGAGLIGGLDWVGLNGVGRRAEPDYAPTIPHLAFMAFQMMFAIITPALITGAFAERKRFKAFVALQRRCGPRSSTPPSRTGSGSPAAGCAPGRPRLRRRHRRPPLLGRLGARRRPCSASGGRSRRGGHRAARPDDDRPGRRAALVRLVRLQRRKRPRQPTASRPSPSSPRTPPRRWPP